MKSRLFPYLGTGVGLRPPHYDHFLNHTPKSIDWVEVISENFMAWESDKQHRLSRPLTLLKQVRKNYPVVLHGVSLSIGSADPLNRPYLKRLKALTKQIEPSWISDHLCWTGIDGQNIHDLLPVPYTDEALKLISNKISRVQDLLGQRILIENPTTYASFEFSEMSEWEFLSELSQRADCGLLLDVNNVYVSSVNHGFNPIHYLKALPLHRIGQIHLAGHSKQNGFLIDTHDEAICPEVWSLYQWTTQYLKSHMGHTGQISSMIERDANIPEWSELELEILKMRSIQAETHKTTVPAPMAATV